MTTSKRTRVWTMLLMLALVALLAACTAPAAPGGSAGEAPAAGGDTAAASDAGSDAAPAGDKVQVKLATWAGVNEANELQAIIDELNAASESYEIVQESSPAEYWTKLQTTVAASTAADLIWMDQEHLPDFAINGALLDLTDALAASDKPAADLADYYPAALERYTVDERVYGLPWLAQPVMLYVNLDMLEAAGYSEEDVNNWTWDDFAEACNAMTLDSAGNALGSDGFAAGDVTQYGFTLVPGWPPVQQFMWQAGGQELSDDLTTSPIDTPEAIAGANFVAQIATSGCAPEQSVISERGFDGMFKGGQVAMFMGGATDDHERTEGLRIKAFLLPQGPVGRDNWAWIGGMSINGATANPEVATEAFLDLTQAIQEWKVPAPRISMANAEAIVAALPFKEISAENIVANLEHMRAPHIFPGYAQWATVFGERFVDPLVRGTGTAEELAAEVKPLLDDVLAENAR